MEISMMFGKRKQTVKPLPEGFCAADIKTESSICTGETTIGFYDKQKKRLVFAELAKDEADIDAFYEKYGLKREG